MTEDTLLPVRSSSRRPQEGDRRFRGRALSSDGGLVLLRAAELRLGPAETLAGCIQEWRDPDRVVHTLSAMLRFHMFAIACGEACPRAGEAGPVEGRRRLRRAARRSPSVMGRLPSSTDPNNRTIRARFWFTSLGACDGLHGPGAVLKLPEGLRVEGARFERLAVLRRDDLGYVRRRVLSSVCGRHIGRQRHARSKANPECRSDQHARPQQGGSANRFSDEHHREPRPGEGTPVIATFRRDPLLFFLLPASRTQPRLCRVERHRRLAGEAELGAVPPHPVEHHADPPGERDGRALSAA